MSIELATSRRVLVTGANRGLGLEFVRQLLARGDRVIAACRRPAEAETLTALAVLHPAALQVLPLNVVDPSSRAELLATVARDWGALDLLINNAAVMSHGERFGELDAANFRAAFEANTIAPLLLTEAAAPLLGKGRAPVVAHVSSLLGSIEATQTFTPASYSVSKAALNMAAKIAAHPLAERGIRSVLLHPGWVLTDMGGPNAPLRAPESVAGMLRVIDDLPPEARGDFLDYTGARLPW